MSYGLKVWGKNAVETLNTDSFSMRTVFTTTRATINANGEDISLPGFDPAKGVAFVITYNAPAINAFQSYGVVGSYPNAILRFFSLNGATIAPRSYAIFAVHYL